MSARRGSFITSWRNGGSDEPWTVLFVGQRRGLDEPQFPGVGEILIEDSGEESAVRSVLLPSETLFESPEEVDVSSQWTEYSTASTKPSRPAKRSGIVAAWTGKGDRMRA